MDKSKEELSCEETDILIYIQKRLSNLEKECATSLLIIRDLQKQLRSKIFLPKHLEPGSFIHAELNNINVPSETVTRLKEIVIPESGIYIIDINIQLHSYKRVKFQHLSVGGAAIISTYNDPCDLSNKLKTADKALRINSTVELNKNDKIYVDYYHISSNDKKIIRSMVEIHQIQ